MVSFVWYKILYAMVYGLVRNGMRDCSKRPFYKSVIGLVWRGMVYGMA